MWQSNQAKAVLRAREKERQKRQAFGARSIKRVDVQLAVLKHNTLSATSRMPAKIVLNEISPAGAEILTPVKLPIDTDLELSFEQPKIFKVRGRIVRVQEIPFAAARILSDRRMIFRTTVQFLVADEAGKAEVAEWVNVIRNSYLGGLALSALPGEPKVSAIESPPVATTAATENPAPAESAAAAMEAAPSPEIAPAATEAAAPEAVAAPAEEPEKKAA